LNDLGRLLVLTTLGWFAILAVAAMLGGL